MAFTQPELHFYKISQIHKEGTMSLLKKTLCFAAASLMLASINTNAAKMKNSKRYPEKADYISSSNKKIYRLNKAGEAIWEIVAKGNPHDLQYLPNGNILFACGTHVREVTPDKEIVFEYKPANQKGGGSYSCQRLPNGITVIGENSTCRVLEFDKTGKQIFELACNTTGKGHHKMRLARKLKNGNYLVCHSGEKSVREYNPKGETVWQQKTKALCFQAERLPNGNTLVSTLPKLIEYKPDGSIAWEFKNTDIDGTVITNMTGFKIQPDGNIVVGCYAAYKKGKGTGMFEITRDKKLVWKCTNRSLGNYMMAIDKVIK